MELGEFQAGKHYCVLGRVTHSVFTGAEAPVFQALPDLVPCTSSSSCPSVCFITSFNKLVTVNMSKFFPISVSQFSKSMKPKYRVVGTSNLLPSQREVVEI